MDFFEKLNDFLTSGHHVYLPHVTIDPVIFGYHDQQLKILLLKWRGLDRWGLPGGFIRKQERLSEAANRILQERTGLADVFLQQFHTFGDTLSRAQEPLLSKLAKDWNLKAEEITWLFDRSISICYFSLVEYSKVQVRTDIFTYACEWFSINEVPDLLFGQNTFVEMALAELRKQLYHQPIGLNLLPEKFTLPEIHSLYQTILGVKVDQRNFLRKLLAMGLVKKLDEQRSIGAHRSPYLYQFVGSSEY